ncbi:MAG: hypothetical protein KGI97_02665 [Alphaproteobacteria bacterium]|nr:hypothetical protein [Alphaproteobacteria bacterium]
MSILLTSGPQNTPPPNQPPAKRKRGKSFIAASKEVAQRIKRGALNTWDLGRKVVGNKYVRASGRGVRDAAKYTVKTGAWYVKSSLMPLTLGVAAAGVCYVTQSYTHDMTATNAAHMGFAGMAELAGVGWAAATAGHWVKGIHARHPGKTIKHVVVAGALFAGAASIAGHSDDPFLRIPANITREFGVQPPKLGGVVAGVEDAITDRDASFVLDRGIHSGDRVSVVMADRGFEFGADKAGNPDQMNRLPVAKGQSFCAIGSVGFDNAYVVVESDNGKPAFIRKDMLQQGGNACGQPIQKTVAPSKPSGRPHHRRTHGLHQ